MKIVHLDEWLPNCNFNSEKEAATSSKSKQLWPQYKYKDQTSLQSWKKKKQQTTVRALLQNTKQPFEVLNDAACCGYTFFSWCWGFIRVGFRGEEELGWVRTWRWGLCERFSASVGEFKKVISHTDQKHLYHEMFAIFDHGPFFSWITSNTLTHTVAFVTRSRSASSSSIYFFSYLIVLPHF